MAAVNLKQGTKKSNLGNSNSNGFGDSIFVDEEHKPTTDDQPVPMSLEQTEPMHSESDQMVFSFKCRFCLLFVPQIHFEI